MLNQAIKEKVSKIASDIKLHTASSKTVSRIDLHNSKTWILFSGANSTDTTFSAEVLANAFDRPLFRVDLGMLVSKYIGETEKNVNALFAEAESENPILLLDEADSLFGKRTEVKDSHDRHENQEVSYLLQRLEEYQGVVILVTNLKADIDPEYKSQFRYTVDFQSEKDDAGENIMSDEKDSGHHTNPLRHTNPNTPEPGQSYPNPPEEKEPETRTPRGRSKFSLRSSSTVCKVDTKE